MAKQLRVRPLNRQEIEADKLALALLLLAKALTESCDAAPRSRDGPRTPEVA